MSGSVCSLGAPFNLLGRKYGLLWWHSSLAFTSLSLQIAAQRPVSASSACLLASCPRRNSRLQPKGQGEQQKQQQRQEHLHTEQQAAGSQHRGSLHRRHAPQRKERSPRRTACYIECSLFFPECVRLASWVSSLPSWATDYCGHTTGVGVCRCVLVACSSIYHPTLPTNAPSWPGPPGGALRLMLGRSFLL